MYRHSMGQKRPREDVYDKLRQAQDKVKVQALKIEEQAATIEKLTDEVRTLKQQLINDEDFETRWDPMLQKWLSTSSTESTRLKEELNKANSLIVDLQREVHEFKEQQSYDATLKELAALSDPAPTATGDNQIAGTEIIRGNNSEGNRDNVRNFLSEYTRERKFSDKGTGKKFFSDTIREIFTIFNEKFVVDDYFESRVRNDNGGKIGKTKQHFNEFMLHSISKSVGLQADTYNTVLKNFLGNKYTPTLTY